MRLIPILAGTFKLDGGAMFGVVPKRIWSKLISCDENNLCTWALRCLYIEYDDKKMLIDTGLGDKQDNKFFSNYEPKGDTSIIKALLKNNINPDDITDVLFTHLHFDHCGGAILRKQDQFVPTFINAVYWVGLTHWQLAQNPNAREKASFLKENIEPLTPQLNFIDPLNSPFERIDFITVSGHSEGMLIPIISIKPNKKIMFGADLFPSVHHIPLPYVMAYDMQPLLTLKEKEEAYHLLVDNKIALFFEHDLDHEVAIIERNFDTKKYVVQRTMTLKEYLES